MMTMMVVVVVMMNMMMMMTALIQRYSQLSSRLTALECDRGD